MSCWGFEVRVEQEGCGGGAGQRRLGRKGTSVVSVAWGLNLWVVCCFSEVVVRDGGRCVSHGRLGGSSILFCFWWEGTWRFCFFFLNMNVEMTNRRVRVLFDDGVGGPSANAAFWTLIPSVETVGEFVESLKRKFGITDGKKYLLEIDGAAVPEFEVIFSPLQPFPPPKKTYRAVESKR